MYFRPYNNNKNTLLSNQKTGYNVRGVNLNQLLIGDQIVLQPQFNYQPKADTATHTQTVRARAAWPKMIDFDGLGKKKKAPKAEGGGGGGGMPTD